MEHGKLHSFSNGGKHTGPITFEMLEPLYLNLLVCGIVATQSALETIVICSTQSNAVPGLLSEPEHLGQISS